MLSSAYIFIITVIPTATAGVFTSTLPLATSPVTMDGVTRQPAFYKPSLPTMLAVIGRGVPY